MTKCSQCKQRFFKSQLFPRAQYRRVKLCDECRRKARDYYHKNKDKDKIRSRYMEEQLDKQNRLILKITKLQIKILKM